MAAFPLKQARKQGEQLNGFKFSLAGYVIFFFLIGSEQRVNGVSIITRKIRIVR